MCSNIINNPTEMKKLGNLNLSKIHRKLSDCHPGLELLYAIGFKIKIAESIEQDRLIFNNIRENIDKMNTVYKLLLLSNDQMDTYLSLINEGYTIKQVLIAMNMSGNEEVDEQ